MTATTAGSQLALPSAGGERPRNVLTLTALLVDAAGIMLFAALVGSLVHVRHFGGPFPPKGVKIDRYLGNIVVITMLMAAVTIEWAYNAVRRDQRRQASAALGITIGLGLAVLNLLSWGAGRASFGPGTSPYGTLVTALVLLLGLVVGLGIGFNTFTLFRVAGSQVSAAEPDQLRAAAWYWHFTVLAAVAVWYAVVILR
jgi:heme/copper-type cytochrome/quinol oxidase subunit 3